MEYYATNYGLEVAVVHGISSSLAVPASQNIPFNKTEEVQKVSGVVQEPTKEHQISSDIKINN
jgi:uroporphyrin-III C-methyltransferase